MRPFLIFLLFFTLSCAKKEKPAPPVLKEGEGQAQQALEEVYLQETEAGKKTWELWAASVDLFPGKKVFKKVRFKFYREDKFLYLKGDEAEVVNESGDIFMSGHVSGKTDEGVEFFTDRLFWQAGEGRLFTEDAIKLMSENLYITGQGLETTPKLKEARVIKDVQVTFFQHLNDEEPMVITSDSLQAHFGDRPQAFFEGKVVVRDKQVRVHSDRLNITFSEGGRRVVESIAEGKVEILNPQIEAECGRATLLNEEKKIVLEDNPILWHQKVKCRGTRITYWLEGEKVVVENNIKGVFLPKLVDKPSGDNIK